MKAPDSPDWEDLYLNAGNGLLTITPQGSILHINNTLKSWLAFAGPTPGPSNFLELLSGGSKLYFTLFVLPILELHQEVEEISLSLKSPSGDIAILFNGTMKENAAAEKIIYASVFRLNDRKKFETEILLAKNKAQSETVEKIQTLHNIAYDHAHQFRAPLSNIIGLIGILEEEAGAISNAAIIGMLKESALKLDAAARRIIDQSTVQIS